jgi:hypothetical protein
MRSDYENTLKKSIMLFDSTAPLFLIILILCPIGTLFSIYMGAAWIIGRFSPSVSASLKAYKKIISICLIFSLPLTGLGLYFIYIFIEITNDTAHKIAVKKTRQRFTLTEPHRYGELELPAGTRIVRYDNFDEGEENRAFRLTGLLRAEFPYPIKIANLSVTMIEPETRPYGMLWLSHAQKISGTSCAAGQVAMFNVPLIDYDILAEFGNEPPDGPEARLKPSQWIFVKCVNADTVDLAKPNTELWEKKPK